MRARSYEGFVLGSILPPSITFPQNGIIDTFTGTDAVDLPVYDAAKWATVANASNLEIISNAVRSTVAAGVHAANRWVGSGFGGADVEIYATITAKPEDSRVAMLFVRGTTTDLATIDGYGIQAVTLAGTDEIRLVEILDGGATTLGLAFQQEITAGDSFGMKIVGGILSAYYKVGAGPWTLLGTREDSTYSAAGHAGIYTNSDITVMRLDDLGGGPAT